MLQELIFTSAPVGLKPGIQGFCTVACTTGMPPNLAKLLESLSGYRHVFLPPDANATKNPPACSHLLLNLGGVPWHILSRTADAGLDYMQRTNKISHHLVLDKVELQEAGPAAVLSQYQFLASWNQKPVVLPANKKLPAISSPPRICERWAQLTGDAGWGGILAETALTKRPVSIIFRPGMNMLPLLDEAMALLPPELRWQISFSTYCCNLPNGTGCQWKCILAGSPEMAQARLTANTLVIDLTQTLGKPPAGQLVEAARTGKPPEKQDGVIPLAAQGEGVYGIKGTGAPPQPGVPASVPATPADSPPKAKSGKPKKKGDDDASSKGCFWLIIAFFILITAVAFGGMFWLYGNNITKSGTATVQQKNINDMQNTINELEKRIAGDKSKQEQLARDNAKWQEEKVENAKSLSAKDEYINRVAGYFSIFPQVHLPPVSINLKDGIPRKEGDQDPLNELFAFNGTLDRTWNIKDMLAVNVNCPDELLTCQSAGPASTYPAGNVLLGCPYRLYAQKDDDSYEPIAEFELVVTESGISVRRFNDEAWNKFVAAALEKMYQTETTDAAFKNEKLIEWYETNVKGKPFVLDEEMLKKIAELDASVFTSDFADLARLIALRQACEEGGIALEFDFGLNMTTLTDKVNRDKP